MPAVVLAMKSTCPFSAPICADIFSAFSMSEPDSTFGSSWAGSPPGEAPVTSTMI